MAKVRKNIEKLYASYVAACAAGKTRKEFAAEEGYKSVACLHQALTKMKERIDAANIARKAEGKKEVPFPTLRDARKVVDWDALAEITATNGGEENPSDTEAKTEAEVG